MQARGALRWAARVALRGLTPRRMWRGITLLRERRRVPSASAEAPVEPQDIAKTTPQLVCTSGAATTTCSRQSRVLRPEAGAVGTGTQTSSLSVDRFAQRIADSLGLDIPGDAAIRLVCATRQPTAADFHNKTALGRSLASWYPNLPSVALQLFPANQEGLPFVYNKAIDRITTPDEILVFLHDDLHLVDLFWANKLRQAVEHFNIIGLAGNRRRAKRQPSWAFVDEHLTWDKSENLSGSVGHGNGFPSPVSHYGPAPQKCLLLDGLLLAVRGDILHRHGLRFDERFRFHFYDMDFCRQAEQSGASMGTWPIAVIHESGGSVGSESWQAGLAAYFDKWDE
jgi:Glycosyltransferase like family